VVGDERRTTWRRRLLRLYSAALVVWTIAVVLSLTVFGGIDSPVTAIQIVVTFLAIAVLIVGAWLSEREDRPAR